MGRPLRRAETVDGNFHTGAIGPSAGTGQQITMQAFVEGGSANVTTEIVQKGTKKFRVTTSDGTQTCQLVAVASGSLAAGQCSLVATDSDGNTAYVTKLTSNYATLENIDSTQFATGDRALWLDDTASAVANVSVLLVTA
jgi:hypothetical protein